MTLFGGLLGRQNESSGECSTVTSDVEGARDKPLDQLDRTPVRFFRMRIVMMAVIVSMGGLIFGYDTGQISGFVAMQDFVQRFGDNGGFTNWKEGTIVGLVSDH